MASASVKQTAPLMVRMDGATINCVAVKATDTYLTVGSRVQVQARDPLPPLVTGVLQ